MIPCRDLSKLQCTWRHRAFPAQAGYRPRYRQGLAAPGRDGPPGILSSAKLGRDHRAQRFAVQQITAQAGGLAAIQDQGPGATFVQGMQTGLHLGDHAAVDDTGLDELGDAGAVQGGDQLLVRIQDAGNVGDQHEVVGMQGPGHGTGRRVRIDVQGLAFRTGGHWRHHGQEAAVQQTGKHGGIDLFHIAHQAQHRVLHPRPQQARITPGKARSTGAVLQETADHGLVDLAAQHHLHGLHGVGIGHAQALLKTALDGQAVQQGVDLGPAAMHHHQAHALLQKCHVVGKGRVQFVLVHGMAAVLDDNSLGAHIFSLRHRHENAVRPPHRCSTPGRGGARGPPLPMCCPPLQGRRIGVILPCLTAAGARLRTPPAYRPQNHLDGLPSMKDSTMNKVVTRFAPSPTGHLHIGGARTAIFCWLLARHFGGEFHLRIEDTDLLRSKQEYTDSILASMRWLGLDWDGPLNYQTQRTELYNSYVDKLLETGHAYWCSCTPEEVEAMREKARAQGLKPRYNGCCRERNLGPGEGRCVRLKAPQAGKVVFDDMVKGRIAVDVSELDDMVIRRADGMPTYNMAVVVDDYEMGITHVIRGDDHVSNTPRQILIYEALGLPVPTFGHVPMILGPDRQKLSKRHGARAVIEYQNDGLLPQALVNYLVRLGWSHGDQEIFTQEELIKFFDGTSLNPAAAAFDPAKLEWINAHFMREMPLDELAKLVRPFVEKAGLPADVADDKLAALCHMFRERAGDLKALAESFRPLLVSADELAYDEKACAKNLTDASKAHLNAVAELFAACDPFDAPGLEAALHGYIEGNGLKFKDVAPALRTALMGFMGGPHLPEIMAFLGKDASLARIRRAAGM